MHFLIQGLKGSWNFSLDDHVEHLISDLQGRVSKGEGEKSEAGKALHDLMSNLKKETWRRRGRAADHSNMRASDEALPMLELQSACTLVTARGLLTYQPPPASRSQAASSAPHYTEACPHHSPATTSKSPVRAASKPAAAPEEGNQTSRKICDKIQPWPAYDAALKSFVSSLEAALDEKVQAGPKAAPSPAVSERFYAVLLGREDVNPKADDDKEYRSLLKRQLEIHKLERASILARLDEWKRFKETLDAHEDLSGVMLGERADGERQDTPCKAVLASVLEVEPPRAGDAGMLPRIYDALEETTSTPAARPARVPNLESLKQQLQNTLEILHKTTAELGRGRAGQEESSGRVAAAKAGEEPVPVAYWELEQQRANKLFEEHCGQAGTMVKEQFRLKFSQVPEWEPLFEALDLSRDDELSWEEFKAFALQKALLAARGELKQVLPHYISRIMVAKERDYCYEHWRLKLKTADASARGSACLMCGKPAQAHSHGDGACYFAILAAQGSSREQVVQEPDLRDGITCLVAHLIDYYEAQLRTKAVLQAQLKECQYCTTYHMISNGIVKLGKIFDLKQVQVGEGEGYRPEIQGENRRVYRGMTKMRMPEMFRVVDMFGCVGGVEFSFLSTSLNRISSGFISYLKSGGAATLLEIEVGQVDRGASLQWLSQYPGECEVCYPPLSMLEVTGKPEYRHIPVSEADLDGETLEVLVYPVRISINLAGARDEDRSWVSSEDKAYASLVLETGESAAKELQAVLRTLELFSDEDMQAVHELFKEAVQGRKPFEDVIESPSGSDAVVKYSVQPFDAEDPGISYWYFAKVGLRVCWDDSVHAQVRPGADRRGCWVRQVGDAVGVDGDRRSKMVEMESRASHTDHTNINIPKDRYRMAEMESQSVEPTEDLDRVLRRQERTGLKTVVERQRKSGGKVLEKLEGLLKDFDPKSPVDQGSFAELLRLSAEASEARKHASVLASALLTQSSSIAFLTKRKKPLGPLLKVHRHSNVKNVVWCVLKMAACFSIVELAVHIDGAEPFLLHQLSACDLNFLTLEYTLGAGHGQGYRNGAG